MAVKQGLTSSKTNNTFSVSRKARYVKIIDHGNKTSNFNSISNVIFNIKK